MDCKNKAHWDGGRPSRALEFRNGRTRHVLGKGFSSDYGQPIRTCPTEAVGQEPELAHSKPTALSRAIDFGPAVDCWTCQKKAIRLPRKPIQLPLPAGAKASAPSVKGERPARMRTVVFSALPQAGSLIARPLRPLAGNQYRLSTIGR